MAYVEEHAVFGVTSSSEGTTASTSEGMNDLHSLADTEESDGPTDNELGRADYWTCVKCKNPQNNPMYRYCEKCYQVSRLNGFPILFFYHELCFYTCLCVVYANVS